MKTIRIPLASPASASMIRAAHPQWEESKEASMLAAKNLMKTFSGARKRHGVGAR